MVEIDIEWTKKWRVKCTTHPPSQCYFCLLCLPSCGQHIIRYLLPPLRLPLLRLGLELRLLLLEELLRTLPEEREELLRLGLKELRLLELLRELRL